MSSSATATASPSASLVVYIDAAPPKQAATEDDTNRPGTNKPRLRQHLIHLALVGDLRLGTVAFHETSTEASGEKLCELYDPAYVAVLHNAWDSALTSGDRHWFDAEMQSLTPLNFPGAQHPLLGERPRTLANLAAPHLARVPFYKLLAYWQNDTMTPLYETTAADARRSVYNTLAACAQLIAEVKGAAAGQPAARKTVFGALNSTPGHHSDQYLSARGYCFLNSAAFAADTLAKELGGNISVLDVDAHAGDGTATLFYERADILTQSIHLDTYDYPSFGAGAEQTGKGAGAGYNVNYPCPPRTDWAAYRKVLEQALARHNQHGSKALIVAFGADTYAHDPDMASPASGFALTVDDYEAMGRLVAERVASDLPILVTQEGGYDMAHVGAIVAAFFRGLVGVKSIAR
jgi:acetoin utilization deacetylase AcuC-like enzyme